LRSTRAFSENATRFRKTHEWIRVENGVGVVGITPYATQALGDLVFVELPKAGLKVKGGGRLASVESVKAASDIYAPADGEVVESNFALEERPALINESPMDQGWIAKIKLSGKLPEDLLTQQQYDKHLKEESH